MKRATIAQLAELVGGQVDGDPRVEIDGINIIRNATDGQITFADRKELAAEVEKSEASAVVVTKDFSESTKTKIIVDDVHKAFTEICIFYKPESHQQPVRISPGANIDPTAVIGSDVQVYPGATIGPNVQIGNGTIIHSGVSILENSKIGENVVIFPNAVLYEETIVGDNCIIHAGAILGAYGFGYATEKGRHILSAQLGNVELENDVDVGAGTTIDRGTYGTTLIGEGTKIDDQVMIGHNCKIGKHNILCSQVGIAGSCNFGDYVILAGQVGVSDHTSVCDHVIVAAKSGLLKDVTESGQYSGIPITPIRTQLQIWAAKSKLPGLRKELKEITKRLSSLESSEAQANSNPGQPQENVERKKPAA